MGVNVKVTDNSGEILKNIDAAVNSALETIGLVAEGYAKKMCPVDTGNLRNSISHAVSGDDKAVYIGTNVSYAPYVELGTSRMKAQPFLTPAASGHGGTYADIIKNALGKLK